MHTKKQVVQYFFHYNYSIINHINLKYFNQDFNNVRETCLYRWFYQMLKLATVGKSFSYISNSIPVLLKIVSEFSKNFQAVFPSSKEPAPCFKVFTIRPTCWRIPLFISSCLVSRTFLSTSFLHAQVLTF